MEKLNFSFPALVSMHTYYNSRRPIHKYESFNIFMIHIYKLMFAYLYNLKYNKYTIIQYFTLITFTQLNEQFISSNEENKFCFFNCIDENNFNQYIIILMTYLDNIKYFQLVYEENDKKLTEMIKNDEFKLFLSQMFD